MVEDKKVPEAVLKKVPTQMGIVIQLPDGREVDELELLVELYNDIQKIKRAV